MNRLGHFVTIVAHPPERGSPPPAILNYWFPSLFFTYWYIYEECGLGAVQQVAVIGTFAVCACLYVSV